MLEKQKRQLALVAMMLAALALAAPLWGPGLVNTRGGGDSPFLLQRTHQLVANLRAGVFPVRWMPDSAYGLGFPFYNYYSALPFYLAATLVLGGLDILAALKFVQTLGFILSAAAMYGWVWRLSRSRCAACLAGVAYAAAPFHLVNVYVRGDSLSEFFAFAFYPLILWGLDRMQDGKVTTLSLGRHAIRFTTVWLWPAAAYAGLIVTHNISAFIFSPFVLLYLLTLVLRRPDRRRFLLVVGALALAFGLLLSAWVWLPALAETHLAQTQTLTDDYFHHSRHFRTSDLIQRTILFNYSVAPGRDTPFAMGLPQALLALLGTVLLVRAAISRRSRPQDWRASPAVAAFILLGLVISTLMITPASKLLWDSLPLLPMTQFPWRFLSVQALFAAAAAAALVPSGRLRACAALLVPSVLVACVLVPLRPDRLPIGPDDVTTERLQLYELFTQNIGTTIRHEWLPRDAVPRPFTSDALISPGVPLGAVPLGGAALTATPGARSPTSQEWTVSGEGGSIAFPLLYWPGWSATVGGANVPVEPIEGSGLISLTVPPGDNTVILRLRRTPVRLIAEIVSALALVLAAGSLAVSRRKVRWRRAALRAGAVTIPALMAVFLPTGIPSDDAGLTMDFDQMPYLHHNPGGVAFSGGPRLESYSVSTSDVAPGGHLSVTSEWSGVPAGYSATLRLVSPAALRHETAPLAQVTRELTEVGGDWVLDLPDELSRGVYLIQLSIHGPDGEVRALTPGGRSRGLLYLEPVNVPRGAVLPEDTPLLAPFGPAIRLHSSTIAPAGGNWLKVDLGWSTRYTLPANYGISLRLLNENGDVLTAFDTQPGYGYLPTSMWRPEELVSDWYLIPSPAGQAVRRGCSLHVILYQVASGHPVGEARLGPFDLPMEMPFEATSPPRSFAFPQLDHASGATFGDEVELAGYDLDRNGVSVDLTLWWRALINPTGDYTVFVHLFDVSTDLIVAQSDAVPQGGSYPTSWWAAGEVVSETVSLSTEDLSSGEYRLAVGLYDRTVDRLTAVSPDGLHVPDNRLVLDEPVELK